MWLTPHTPNTESHCATLAFVHRPCSSKHLYPSGLNRTSCVISLFPEGFYCHPCDCFFFKFTQSLLVQFSKAWHSNQKCAYIELQITLRNKRQKAALSNFATGSMSSPELLWAQVQLPHKTHVSALTMKTWLVGVLQLRGYSNSPPSLKPHRGCSATWLLRDYVTA